MLKDVTFGQYYPCKSPIHRLDPRAKLLFTIFFIVIIFFVSSYTGYAAVALFLLSVIFLAHIPFTSILKSIKGILILLIFCSLLNIFFYQQGTVLGEWWVFKITDEGLHFAFQMALRLTLLVTGSSILMLTTTPTELTDGMESLMRPLKVIRFPVHDIALVMNIALRFIPSLLEETDKIIMAQKARGASFDNGNLFKRAKALIPVLIPLLVSAFMRADELALALDSRCYDATPKRTKFKALKFSLRDVVALFFVAVLGGVIIGDYVLGGYDMLLSALMFGA